LGQSHQEIAVKSQFLSLLAVTAAVTLLTAPMTPVHAVNLNTSGLICQQSLAQDFDSPLENRIQYFDLGVVNAADVRTEVVCSVPRSPVAAGATTVNFFVDGQNSPGAATICSITSYDYLGNFAGSRSFETINTGVSFAPYDVFVSFPAALVGFYNYVTLTCVLPRSFTGRLNGVTALQ
jgi:hypothetical protein